MSKSLFPPLAPGPNTLVAPVTAPTTPVAPAARNNARLTNGMLLGQSVSTLSSGPGPNAFEVGVVSYDPDSGVVNVRVKDAAGADEVDCTVELDKMPGSGTIEIVLGDSKLSPKIEIKISPRVKPPTFTSIEEAEAWMEANA